MQDLHITDKAPLDTSSTLTFAMDLRYLNLAKTNQWEESQVHFMQLCSIILWISSSWKDKEEICLNNEHTPLVLQMD